MKEILKFELTPMPLSLFKLDGNPRIIATKSIMKSDLEVQIASRSRKPDITILDGCAILWIIQWPSVNRTLVPW